MKKFKTIVIEHLDEQENDDVVEGLNSIINQGIVGSGSRAFLYAVRQYLINREQISNLKTSLLCVQTELEAYQKNSRKVIEFISFVSEVNKIDSEVKPS